MWSTSYPPCKLTIASFLENFSILIIQKVGLSWNCLMFFSVHSFNLLDFSTRYLYIHTAENIFCLFVFLLKRFHAFLFNFKILVRDFFLDLDFHQVIKQTNKQQNITIIYIHTHICPEKSCCKMFTHLNTYIIIHNPIYAPWLKLTSEFKFNSLL